MRTIKRKALPLNKNKLFAIKQLCQAYAKEKNRWLNVLRDWKYQSLLGSSRKIRDEFIKQDYHSKYSLQARHWKLALQDAVETWDKNWKAQFISVRSRIASHFKQEAERRYAYRLILGYAQFSQMMQGEVPKPNFEIAEKKCNTITSYIQRQVRKRKVKQAVVKKSRSVKFDSNCYSVFEEKGCQYIKIMSLEKGKRIVIPLRGQAKIEGTGTLVVDEEDVFIHVSEEITNIHTSNETIEAVDFGYSEVMTDTEGKRYGIDFGKILTKASDRRHDKMRKRHKLHAYQKKQAKKHSKKRLNIRKYNLGTKKLNKVRKKETASLEKEINTGINLLLKNKNPGILVTENLSHSFSYNRPKSVNRRLSSWLRGKLQERVAFKALAEGFRHEQVNPAYGSQTCTCCDFVDSKNRKGDKFKCLDCGHEDLSDRVAAMNYAKRLGDQEIGLYVPYSQVKTILFDRFRRRLETGKPVTVPGRTLETVEGIGSQMSFEIENIIAGRKYSQTGRSIKERNKINTF